jgi:hypothetical protein
MMRAEQGRAKPPELPKRRGRKKKEESPVEMEGLKDVSELANEAANETADRESGIVGKNAESAEALTRKMEQMAEQKEVNLKNSALSESMAKKINAEIDRNIEELGRKRDELEGIVTSAAPIEKLVSKAPKAKKAPLGPRKAGEAPRTYEEHRADLNEAFDNMEREANRDTLVDVEIPGRMNKAAEEHEAVDVDLTELNQEATEDAFFSRGEKIGAAHEAGQELEATETEKAGQRKQDRFEGRSRDQELLAERAELLEQEIPRIQNAVTAAERRLNREFGISDPDETLRGRASSVWESAKGFFGGLFSKKEKMKNTALEDYQRLRDRLTDRQSELQETKNRLERPEDIRKAMQLKGERKKP